MPSLSTPVVASFTALTCALVMLWAARPDQPFRGWWAIPFAVALVAAQTGRLLDVRGLAALLLLCAGAVLARSASSRPVRGVAHGVVLALAAGLLLHVVPGFDNPRVLHDAVLSSGAEPYTKYLNFDKGAAGLLLLGLYVPDRTTRDQGLRHLSSFTWRFAMLAAVVLMLTLAAGYVRWDPKLPPWWPMWLWSMVFLTALPEETVFRGLAQDFIGTRLGGAARHRTLAACVAGTLFGLAHAAGGPTYVLLACIAGIGYGLIYAATRSLAAAIAAHAGLNAIHFFCFSYPGLAVPLDAFWR
jgi:membrane protease YdiL (CAAX protease family)